MSYAILRTTKLKTAGNCGGLNNHLERTMEVPNADRELTYLNYRKAGSGDLVKDVATRIQAAGIEKPRKNAVLAIEHLMTASPEAFRFTKTVDKAGNATLSGSTEDRQRWNDFANGCLEWLNHRYGAANVVNFTVHLDEQTPHIHAIVVPIDAKSKLNCRHYLGGREKLRDLQDSFAQQHATLGLERGIKGSKAHHTTVKQFYGQAKAFEQTPALELKIDRARASIQAPEMNLFGQMKQSPEEYVSSQQKQLETQWTVQQNKILQQAQQKTQELHKAAQAAELLKLENERLKGQLKGLQQEIEQVIKDVTQVVNQHEMGKHLLELLMQGRIRLEELHQATEQMPSEEDKRQTTIWNLLKNTGLTVKESAQEQEIEIKKSQGPKR
jgi:hypothetical protein